MKEKKTDLRIIKTKNLLYSTLIALLKDYTFEEIKVSDICNKALINRSTFYAHYSDKYELLSSCIQDIKEELASKLRSNTNISNTKEYYMEMLDLFLTHIDENRELFSSIIINNKNSVIMDIFYATINADLTKRLKEEDKRYESIVPEEIITNFYVGAVVNVSMKWLTDYQKYTKADLIGFLDCLIPDKIGEKKIEFYSIFSNISTLLFSRLFRFSLIIPYNDLLCYSLLEISFE